MKTYDDDCRTLLNLLGLRGLKSFGKMYEGGTDNVFGRPDSSVSMCTLVENVNDDICCLEMNTIYFSHTKKTIAFNDAIQALNINKEYTFGVPLEQCIEIARNL